MHKEFVDIFLGNTVFNHDVQCNDADLVVIGNILKRELSAIIEIVRFDYVGPITVSKIMGRMFLM